ncbi:hypothetical protein [Moorena sp. SIO3I8]|uniref:hypothetical protein n=1 Tax=Moorena sp. SIO3I8 TaxID=2607833 RepID=UPI0013BEE708|nr:hypothetical protein [Moorena sp. SIO3I8]NEO04881.1 hypothetical protein [Moorena sp. SIO3I8]
MLFNLCSFLKQKQQARGWSMVERLRVISNVIAEVRSQKSEVRSQKSEVRSQKSNSCAYLGLRLLSCPRLPWRLLEFEIPSPSIIKLQPTLQRTPGQKPPPTLQPPTLANRPRDRVQPSNPSTSNLGQ